MRSAILVLVVLVGCVDEGEPVELAERAAALQVCGGSLQAAIDAAPQDTVIEICAGTYHERLSIDGKRLELRGLSGAAVTTIDADGLGRALEVRNTGGTGVLVSGLTLREGVASTNGGGIACRQSTLRMRDSVVTGGRAVGGGGLGAEGCELDIAGTRFDGNDAPDARGGGALLIASTGTVTSSTFAGNDAEEGGGVAIEGGTVGFADNDVTGNSAHRGGGVFVGYDGKVRGNRIVDNEGRWTGGGIYVDNRAATIDGNLIDGNTAVNDGGGCYVHQGAPWIVDNVVTANQTGDDGGGVRLFESTARVEGNRIEDNTAADSGGGVRVSHLPALLVDNLIRNNVAVLGGGLDLDNDASVLRGGEITGNRATDGAGIAAGIYPWNGAAIEDVLLADNIATGSGGALYLVDNLKPIALRHLVVRGNRAARGAGMYVRATDHTLANAVFDRNVATGDGGALYVAASSTAATYDFLVLHANTAASGSALWTAAPVSLENSILEGNSGTGVRVSVAPTYRYNDTRPRSFSGMADPTGSSGNLSADPFFADAAGGNFALASGSAAIDAGDPALHDVNGTRADQGLHGGPDGTDAPPPPPPPPTGAAVLEADAHVAADSPTVSFGTATTLASDTSPLTEAYLRFRVTNAGTITGARLQLTVTNPTGDAPTLHAAASTWDEATITWNNRPALGAAVADLGAVATGIVEYDVTSLVTGDGVYTLALIPTSTDGFAAYAREGSAAPRLILTTGTAGPSAVLEADTYAAADAPTTAFGAATLLSSDSSPLEETYLRFRVAGLTAPPAHARLRLLCTDASSDGPALHLAASTWTESTLTWNTRPALTSGPLADLGAASLGQTVEYDVTSAITADGVYTFALLPTSSSGFGVSSREGGTPPVLLLD